MKKLLLISFAVLSFSRAEAKITLDAVSTSPFVSATTAVWGHKMGDATAGCTNSILVAVCGEDAATITSITYKGIPMTQQAFLNSTEAIGIYTLNNSTLTGVNNIIATFGSAVNAICGSVSFCGVQAITPKDASATQQATSANPSIAVTVVSSGSVLVDGIFNNGGAVMIASPQYGQITNLSDNGGPSTTLAHFSLPVLAGSQSMSWVGGTSRAWTKAVLSLKPSTGTPIMQTLNPTAITKVSVTANGQLLNTGGFQVTAFGVCVATSPMPTTADSCFNGSGNPFTASVTGLTTNTAYHIRAYGTNSIGTDYGDDIPFVTLPNNGVATSSGGGKISTANGTGNIFLQ